MIEHWLSLFDKGELEVNKIVDVIRGFAPMLDGVIGMLLPHLPATHPGVAAVAAMPPVPVLPTAV